MFWIRPPTHPTGNGDGNPQSVVLDAKAYLDDRTNASTAECFTHKGHLMKVTFWFAPPPRLSYFTVDFPDLPELTDLAELPRVLGTDGGLVLLRVAICHPDLVVYPHYNDYVIYRADSDKLQVLPTHPKRLFPDLVVGILDCRSNGRFVVAALCSALRRGHYTLDLFDSEAPSWSTKSVLVESQHAENYSFISATKVIALGDSSIGWVDLSKGILIFDVLPGGGGDDVLRYIRLPLLMHRGPSSADRDIAVGTNGCINFFEMCVHAVPGSHIGLTYISQDWEAATWTWSDSDKKWHEGCTFKASEISVDKSYSELLPDLRHYDLPDHDLSYYYEAMKTKPILSRLHVGHPALSLHDDGVVYIMAKVDHRDRDKAWMLAVDMRNKALKGVADFSAERTSSFRLTYLHSGISKHLGAEVEEDRRMDVSSSNQTEEASWTEVSYKKKKSGRSIFIRNNKRS